MVDREALSQPPNTGKSFLPWLVAKETMIKRHFWSLVLLHCVQALHAQKTRSLSLGHEGRFVEAKIAFRALPIANGETHVCQPSKRNRKNRGFQCSSVLVRSDLSRASCFVKKKEVRLCAVRTFFASLNSLAVPRTRVTSTGLRPGHIASQNGPPFCANIIGKTSAPRTHV